MVTYPGWTLASRPVPAGTGSGHQTAAQRIKSKSKRYDSVQILIFAVTFTERKRCQLWFTGYKRKVIRKNTLSFTASSQGQAEKWTSLRARHPFYLSSSSVRDSVWTAAFNFTATQWHHMLSDLQTGRSPYAAKTGSWSSFVTRFDLMGCCKVPGNLCDTPLCSVHSECNVCLRD